MTPHVCLCVFARTEQKRVCFTQFCLFLFLSGSVTTLPSMDVCYNSPHSRESLKSRITTIIISGIRINKTGCNSETRQTLESAENQFRFVADRLNEQKKTRTAHKTGKCFGIFAKSGSGSHNWGLLLIRVISIKIFSSKRNYREESNACRNFTRPPSSPRFELKETKNLHESTSATELC